MNSRSARFLSLCCCLLLIAVAAAGWLTFVGHGIAYGDLVGAPGSDRALADVGRRAQRGLVLGASCEAVAIALGSWVLVPLRNPIWARIVIAFVLALFADLLTFFAIGP